MLFIKVDSTTVVSGVEYFSLYRRGFDDPWTGICVALTSTNCHRNTWSLILMVLPIVTLAILDLLANHWTWLDWRSLWNTLWGVLAHLVHVQSHEPLGGSCQDLAWIAAAQPPVGQVGGKLCLTSNALLCLLGPSTDAVANITVQQ